MGPRGSLPHPRPGPEPRSVRVQAGQALPVQGGGRKAPRGLSEAPGASARADRPPDRSRDGPGAHLRPHDDAHRALHAVGHLPRLSDLPREARCGRKGARDPPLSAPGAAGSFGRAGDGGQLPDRLAPDRRRLGSGHRRDRLDRRRRPGARTALDRARSRDPQRAAAGAERRARGERSRGEPGAGAVEPAAARRGRVDDRAAGAHLPQLPSGGPDRPGAGTGRRGGRG